MFVMLEIIIEVNLKTFGIPKCMETWSQKRRDWKNSFELLSHFNTPKFIYIQSIHREIVLYKQYALSAVRKFAQAVCVVIKVKMLPNEVNYQVKVLQRRCMYAVAVVCVMSAPLCIYAYAYGHRLFTGAHIVKFWGKNNKANFMYCYTNTYTYFLLFAV